MVVGPCWRRASAACILQRVRYCTAGSPASWVKRAAKAERDIAARLAREASVQGCPGLRCMATIAWPIGGAVLLWGGRDPQHASAAVSPAVLAGAAALVMTSFGSCTLSSVISRPPDPR